ncbi:hypothetical protein GKD24_13410 [Lactobacillus paracasei]|uniref:hypothetical protein n=1 Tax=Lactobacillales TaxID=186826 RepID=UPI0012AFBA5B|nr:MULTISPECIES: hypothetical protein [Lactobacillales]MSC19277.1 hypothetical protein [Lacticaseibacillus paracasei]MZG93846.1 hypothetical protein [Enterococcus durans]NAA43557.1 hypothetical protein [Enterococcus faecalis]NAA59630.1 hypothetical protein [Enterococcus mundtii]
MSDEIVKYSNQFNNQALRKFTALDLDLLMAVIAVCLAPAVHPIAADIILTALAVWAMRNSR